MTPSEISEKWWNAPMPERPLWKDALHIFAVFNFAVAYPLLDMAGQADWSFVVENGTWFDVVMVAAIVCLLLPALIAGALALVEVLSSRVRSAIHALLIIVFLILGSFLTLISMADVVVATMWGPVLFLVGMIVAFLYLRFDAVQSFATILILSVVVVPGYFLTGTDVSRIVFAGDTPEITPARVDSQIPVVLVVYDELPLASLLDASMEIDADQYPNFARLAGNAYWFTNATTVQEATRYALPAILTGTLPDIESLPTTEYYPRNLFAMLETSHEMLVNEPATLLCPDTTCERSSPDLSARVSMWLRSVTGQKFPSITAAESRHEMDEEFTKRVQDSETPQLLFHHSLIPHFPWIHLPSGTQYVQTERSTIGLDHGIAWSNDDWLVAQSYQRHLLQVQYVDKLLGEIITKTKEMGIYDDALIIIAADHGISFRPGERNRRFSPDTVASILSVPFFVKLPGQTEGVVSDRNVQTIDILPTIADVLNVEHEWDFDGLSVFDESVLAPGIKTVVSGSGEHLEFPSPIEGLERAVLEKIDMFGTGPEHGSLFRLGVYRDLVGVEIDGVSGNPSTEYRVSLDAPDRYAEMDLNGVSIPAFIQGTIDVGPGEGGREIHLAVAVNGTIRAVTQDYQDDGANRFGAMVPEESFVKGNNDVDVFLVSGFPNAPELTLLSTD